MIEVQQHLDDLIGMHLRDRYAERPGVFWDLVENPTAMTIWELNDLLQRAEDGGRLTHADARRVLWTDIVIRGGNADAPAYLLVNVSRKWQSMTFAEPSSGPRSFAMPASTLDLSLRAKGSDGAPWAWLSGWE